MSIFKHWKTGGAGWWKETNETNPIIAQAFCLEAISGLRRKEGNVQQSVTELRTQRSEFRETETESGAEHERGGIFTEKAPEICTGVSLRVGLNTSVTKGEISWAWASSSQKENNSLWIWKSKIPWAQQDWKDFRCPWVGVEKPP